MAKVCVIGLGYIGLPAAALMAKAGHSVIGVDVQPHVVETVNAGKTHLEEPGLPELVREVVHAGNLKATKTPEKADVFMIAVPTPFIEESKKADMKYVRSATESIIPHLDEGNLVLLESTSPLGATKNDVAEVIYSKRPELEGKLHICYCPERAIPGKTLEEMVENDRSVGGIDEASTNAGIEFYKSFVTGELIETSDKVAEMVKLAENASRDCQIAFANELSLACDALDINVWEVIKLANRHPRVNIFQPGPGVGGHCIAVDPWFIISMASEVTPFMRTARAVNDGKPDWVVEKIKTACNLKPNSKITLLGLAYKPDVDDFRESPSITVAEKLKEQGLEFSVCEPFMQTSDRYKLIPLEEALKADVIVMLTDHTLFKQKITLADIEGKQVIDTRGTFQAL